MQQKIRTIGMIGTLIVALVFGVYWIQQYLQRSRASATPPTAVLSIAGPQVNPGETFDLILSINPNLTPFYSFDLAFTYDATKVEPGEITPLSTKGVELADVVLLKGVGSTNIDTAAHTVRISAIRATGASDPFIGRDPIQMVKVSFKMKEGVELPLDFTWIDPEPGKITTSDSFEKKNLSYTGEAEVVSTKIPYVCGSDDFAASSLNKEVWLDWTGSTPGQNGLIKLANGKVTFSIPGSAESKGVSIFTQKLITGDFTAEVTLENHSVLDDKLTSNFFFQFHNSDWSKGVSILKAYNKSPAELIFAWLEAKDNWKNVGKNDGIDHNTPVRVKIEREGSLFKLSYKKLDGAYILMKQIDNYYDGEGWLAIGLDDWGPDFPQATATADDFELTCYKDGVSVSPINVPSSTPVPGVVQPTGAYNSLTPVPTIQGGSAQIGQTVPYTPRTDLLYINSIASYQSPFRYEQEVQLEKGMYTIKIGAKVYVSKERGMVVGIAKKMGQMVYTSKVFPVKAEFSEMTDSFTIPDDADNKQYIVRVFCEDGSECELDYITIEDAWGSERLLNNNFEAVTNFSDPRKQPANWEFDTTANIYGSIDQAVGVRGALMINNSAK